MKPPIAEILTATLAIGMICETCRDVAILAGHVIERIERRFP